MSNSLFTKPNWVEEPKNIDFQSVNTPLKEVYNQLVSKLENEQDSKSNSSFILRSLLILNFQTYKAICELVKDENQAKYSLQGHFLARTVLDGVFNTLLIVDNPDHNTNWFEASGFKDFWEGYQMDLLRYKDDPKVNDYLEEKKKLFEHLSKFLKIPLEQVNDPATIKYWPTPPQLLKQKILSLERQAFLEEMNKWHYQELSEWSHGQWSGTAMAIFTSMPESHWNPGKFDSDAAYLGQLFLLIIMSEIIGYKKYNLNQEIIKIWDILREAFEEVNDYFQLRYEKSLSY